MADEVQTDTTAPAAADSTPTEVQLPSLEDVARKLGWKPKEEYKGPEENYRGPDEFIMKGQAGNLVQEIKALKTTQERLVRTSAATTARMLDEQAQEINARWQAAVDAGDHAATRTAERELRALEVQRNDVSPEATFASENPWYGKDDDATAYAISVSQREAAKGKSIPDQLEAAQSAVKKRFPELFPDETPAPRPNAPQVSTPSSRTASATKRERGAADLPRDVRQAGEEFVQMAKDKGRKYSIDDFARTYWSEQPQVA